MSTKEFLMTPLSKNLRIIGMGLMSLYAIFFLVMGVGEMIGGDASGSSHLLPAAIIAGMTAVAWKRPTIAGALLLGIGLIAAIYFFAIFTTNLIFGKIIMAGLPILSGII